MPDESTVLTEARTAHPIIWIFLRTLIIAAVVFVLISIFPAAAVRGAGLYAGAMAKNLEGGEKIAALALSGLADAKVTPHLVLCAVNAAACAAVAGIRRAVSSKAAKLILAVLMALAVIASAAASLWMCKINGVPLRLFVIILSDLLNSGIL